MKKHTIIIFLFILFLIFTNNSLIFAAETEYRTAAENFLKYHNSDKKIISVSVLEANSLDPAGPPVVTGYVMQLEGGGYILVSASKQLTPVKAYSLKCDFEALPPEYRQFLVFETEYNIRAINEASRTTQSTTLSGAEKSWDFLLYPEKYRTAQAYTPDTHLLTTQWNQGYPYDKFLPEIDGEKVLAGCVNIAMAQLMKYHNYPARGYGVETYTWNSQILKSIMYRPYNWENMPDVIYGTEPAFQTDEVALLIRDLGIANRTNFGIDGSGASVNINTLFENFGYAGTIQSMSNDVDVELFFKTIRDEIDAERPMLLRFPPYETEDGHNIAGHVTVADGYSSDLTGREIHVNFGWGGSADGYYFLDETVNAGDYSYPTSLPYLKIYYNIKPCSGDNCFRNLEAEDSIDEQGVNISGKFNYDRDNDQYEVYLKGSTTITGNRGYSNRAFHITLYDSDHNPISLQDDDVVLSHENIAPGRYYLNASLWSDSSVFTYDDLIDYTIQISTGELTVAEKEAADTAWDKAPDIGNEFADVVLNNTDSNAHKILVDARDENGDDISLSISNSNPLAVEAALNGNILSLSPVQGALNVAAGITVAATANDITTEKSFVVMVTNSDVAFGRSFEISGVFENQDDYNTHMVVLDGDYTISGDRGFSNQAFFTSILDAGGVTVAGPADVSISGNTERGIYSIKAALNGPDYIFNYNEGVNAGYVISVKCPNADVSTETIAGILGVDLSGVIVYLKGDVNSSGAVDLEDAILALKALSNALSVAEDVDFKGDANGDRKIGPEEAIYVLQSLAE